MISPPAATIGAEGAELAHHDDHDVSAVHDDDDEHHVPPADDHHHGAAADDHDDQSPVDHDDDIAAEHDHDDEAGHDVAPGIARRVWASWVRRVLGRWTQLRVGPDGHVHADACGPGRHDPAACACARPHRGERGIGTGTRRHLDLRRRGAASTGAGAPGMIAVRRSWWADPDLVVAANAFALGYALRSDVTVNQLREWGRFPEPCDCGEPGCEGFIMNFAWEDAIVANMLQAPGSRCERDKWNPFR
jgi:hypothetical protein